MEPLDQSKVMHLQDSLSSVLDLSMNCKKSHTSSSSTDALVKKPTWYDLGRGDQSPGDFSDVRTEHCISLLRPGIPPQDVYSEPALRMPYYTNPHLGSQNRLNGHLPTSYFPSTVYNCKTKLPKKGIKGDHSCVKPDQEAQHHSSRPSRVDIQNGLGSHLSIPKTARGKTVDPTGQNSHQKNSLTPFVSKISPSKGCKTAVESGIGTPRKMPLHDFSYQDFTSQDHKVNPIHEKVMTNHITEVRHSSSPLYIDSEDSDVIEVPVSNCNKNIQSPQRPTIQQPSACNNSQEGGQTIDGHTTTIHSSGSLGECEDDALRVRTRAYSTSGAVAVQPPKPTSSNVSSDEGAADLHRTMKANAQSRPKQQKAESLAGQAKASPSKAASSAIPTAKRRPKKHRRGPCSSASSMFLPQEPEIKLKYLSQSHKEEKRDGRGDAGFCPYVRVELREVPVCSVVNCQEEDETMRKRQRQRSPPPLKPPQASGVVPGSSCLRLGRLNADGRGKFMQTCSLCGWPANSLGLGDLYGPYLPSECNPASKQALGSPLHQRELGVLENSERAGTSQDRLENSPRNPSERPRGDWSTDGCANTSAALVAHQESGEHWVHEDCSVWSAGVFLIKGRLYGLEESIRLAEKTVCSCCHKVGATLGCFFKGCCNKYHYACALQSDCLLSEDNFSMRCPRHKNKSSRLVTR